MSEQSFVTRLQQAHSKNKITENRSELWEWCDSKSNQVEVTESNLENMVSLKMTTGFFWDVDGATLNTLILLAEAVGASGLINPEGAKHALPINNCVGLSEEQVLAKVKSRLGFEVKLPGFLRSSTAGTNEGQLTTRHCHAIYATKRILEMYPNKDTRIIEIGAGLGLLPYFLASVGYTNYCSIDLATASVCQAYFLHKNLPNTNIILSKEVSDPFDVQHKNSLKLLHASDYVNVPPHSFDLMVNMDGLTEYNYEDACKYANSECAPTLFSINHEMNDYRVVDIVVEKKLKYRVPYWLRPGYVEELYTK